MCEPGVQARVKRAGFWFPPPRARHAVSTPLFQSADSINPQRVCSTIQTALRSRLKPLNNMLCNMNYYLPYSPGSSPTYSARLLAYKRCSASGASVVAIDNKIEQAMDLVKSHLMYAVREEVEVLKEQIKELYERNSVLERENAVLKSLANTEQLNQLGNPGSSSPQQTAANSILQEGSKLVAFPQQPNVSTA